MVSNYIKVSFRKFTRQKFYSLLNIFGLSTGMATVILIMLYVFDEISFDKFHKHEKDLYRVVENQYYSGQPVFPVAVTPGPLAESLNADFPEVIRATRVDYGWSAFQYGESRFDTDGIYVDNDFLHMFDFPFLKGDTATALTQINSVVITPDLARKLFGDDDPMGKTIRVDRTRDVVVTGLLEKLPHNSHLQFDYIMPMSRRLVERSFLKEDWGSNSIYSYVQLVPGADVGAFNAKIQKYVKSKVERSVTEIYLQPITDVHMGEVNFVADFGHKGNRQYVRIFSLVALFILIIACINFMNLSTARGMKRAKEVGLRKTIGAFRYQLVFQFLGESVMVALVALCIALLFVDLLLTPFNTLTQKTLSMDYTNLGGLIPVCLGATLLTGLLAGSYPAFFLSSFQPARVLKGNLANSSAGGTFRKILVIVQFSISIVMISGTIVIYTQMEFIRKINLGWDRKDVVLIPNVSNYEAFKGRLLKYPNVSGVSASNQHPITVMNSTSGIGWRGKSEDEVVLFHSLGVDFDYVETMKIEMLMGRSFSRNSPGDTLSAVINEEVMNILGFENPVGEILTFGGDMKFEIIGVAKNFHFKSVHDRIEPLVLYVDRSGLSNAMVRIAGDAQEALKNIEREWNAVNPDQLFSYSFLDEDFDNLYKAESQTSTIFRYFSLLAIVISCLGLFGLAAYTTEQRSREYGIRKVFGAGAGRLFYLASSEFLVLVVIAYLISVPVAWYWMKNWLDGFAYHVSLSWLVFVLSGLVAVIIALMTVSYQAGKVGMINPAKILRTE